MPRPQRGHDEGYKIDEAVTTASSSGMPATLATASERTLLENTEADSVGADTVDADILGADTEAETLKE